MAIRNTKLNGGKIGEVAPKETKLNQLKSWFNALLSGQKLLLLVILVVAVIGISAIFYRLFYNRTNDTAIIPMDSQQVDQATIDKINNQLKSDPSKIPSGTFHPELGDDYFITKPNNASEKATNQ